MLARIVSFGFCVLASLAGIPHVRAALAPVSIVLTYPTKFDPKSESKLQKDVAIWLGERGYKLTHRIRFAPIEAWSPTGAKAGDSATPTAICTQLLIRFREIKNCEADAPLKPAAKKFGVRKPASTHVGTAQGESDSPDTCPLLESLDGVAQVKPGLSTFWAQEYVGLDLAYRRWEEWRSSLAPSAKVAHETRLAVLDSVVKNHGLAVRDLLAMNIPEGAARTPGAAQRIDFERPSGEGITHNISTILEALDRYPQGLDVVNVSLQSVGETTLAGFRAFAYQHRALFVLAAGNNYPTYDREIESAPVGIVVGSVQPNGLLTRFSSEHAEVTITAPSNLELVVNDPRDPFGGTSGAAPLVSSGLAMLKSVLPDLGEAEAKKIVELTALPTFNAFEAPPRLNGAGTFNALGVLETGIALRDRCGERTVSSEKCVRVFLKKLGAASGSALDPKLATRARAGFDCHRPAGRGGPSKGTCAERRELFTEVRRAAYRNPRAAEAWDLLACVHAQNELPVNAEFYRKLALIGTPPHADEAMRKIIDREARKSEAADRDRLDFLTRKNYAKYRTHPVMGPQIAEFATNRKLREIAALTLKGPSQSAAVQFLAAILAGDNYPLVVAASKRLRELPLADLPEIFRTQLKNPDGAARERLLGHFALLDAAPAAQRAEILSLVLADPDGAVRRAALRALADSAPLPETVAWKFIDAGLQSANGREVEAAIAALAKVSPAAALARIKEIRARGRPNLTVAVLSLTHALPETDALAMIDVGLADADATVRSAALTNLEKFSAPVRFARYSAALKDGEVQVRQRAIESSRALPPTRALDIIARGLRDPDSRVAETSGLALGALPTADILRFVLKALDDPDPQYRANAFTGAGAVQSGDALAVVVKALADAAPAVRRQAVRKAEGLDPKQRKALLLKVLADSDATVAREAAQVLDNLEAGEQPLEISLPRSPWTKNR